VARILRLKFELGLFENPRLPDPADAGGRDRHAPAHTALNLEVARRSLVLLRNDGLLPLSPSQPLRIAVVGPNADDPHTQLGDWAAPPARSTGCPTAIRATSSAPCWTACARWRRPVPPSPTRWALRSPRGRPTRKARASTMASPGPPVAAPAPVDPALLAQAVAAAQAADVVVAVVGDTLALIGEARSTATLDLFGAQNALLEALAATGKPMVVVLLASKTQVLPPAAMGAAAIINAFNPRMRGGQALAELIFGLIEPSGRLPLTFARHAGHLPLFCNRLNGQHGHRYADLTQEPLFAFGEGLSFTTVEPAELELLQRECHQGDTVRTRITLRTNGRRLALGWPPPPMGIPMRCGGHPIASRSDGA
jgi:beta-glucosidase